MANDDQNGGASSSSSSSRTSTDVDGELEQLERRKRELEEEKAAQARAARGPADREEAAVTALVELVIGAAQHKPIGELRRRASTLLETFKS